MTGNYAYHRPRSLDEALRLKINAPESQFIAGGTDLLVNMKRGRADAGPALISLRNIEELGRIDADGKRVRIGATAPLTDVERHPQLNEHFTAVVDSLRTLASRQVRNVASVGGNLCNASPCANTAPALLVFDALVEIIGIEERRRLPLTEFFVGRKLNALAPGEILTAIEMPLPPPGTRSAFFDKGRVAMDLSLASLALRLRLDKGRMVDVRLAAGAVAPTPVRLFEAESILEGQALDDEKIERAKAAAMAAISPITDLRSTAEYRRHIIGVYLERGLERLTEREDQRHD